MDGRVTVRFTESIGYDINEDCEVVRFMGTTGKGSYWADVLLDTPRVLVTARKRFRERVLEALQTGIEPGVIDCG